jgi:hypothetical protein
MDGTRKRGRPRKRWGDEVELDLNTMRINNREWPGIGME